MNSKTLCLALLSCAVTAVTMFALGPGDWVLRSDRSLNPEIIEVLRSADYETALSIMRALGGRGDPYAEDIMLWLVSTFRGRWQYKYDYLLEVLLSSLFDTRLPQSVLRERFVINKTALHRLITDIPHIESTGLKTELIRIIPLAGQKQYAPILAGEASRLIVLLNSQNGNLDIPGEQELIALLSAMETLGVREYAGLCGSIARLSANRDVVVLARKVAAGLLD